VIHVKNSEERGPFQTTREERGPRTARGPLSLQ
jgi:hypothetical protein